MLVNLDDSGNHMNTGVQYRIFRNIPKLRYRNRIHEYLDLSDGRRLFSYDAAETLAIFHTGYASSVFTGKNKEERNIYMIKKELEENPENYMMWSYLGDSLLSDKQFEEAEEAYRRATENPSAVVEIDRKNLSFASLLKVKFGRNADSDEEFLTIYQKAKNVAVLLRM
jgi:tetratricopeptide (TPR) repeat protein